MKEHTASEAAYRGGTRPLTVRERPPGGEPGRKPLPAAVVAPADPLAER